MNSESLSHLINQWVLFTTDSRGQDGSLKDFALWLLSVEGDLIEKWADEEDFKFKILDLSRFLEIQAKILFDGDGGDLQIMRILSIIEKLKNPIKKEVVDSSLLETSTGFYFLKLIAKKGLIREITNSKDRRAFTVVLTAKGKNFLHQKRKDLKKISLFKVIEPGLDRKAFFKALNVLHQYHSTNTQLQLKRFN